MVSSIFEGGAVGVIESNMYIAVDTKMKLQWWSDAGEGLSLLSNIVKWPRWVLWSIIGKLKIIIRRNRDCKSCMLKVWTCITFEWHNVLAFIVEVNK